MDVNFKTTIFNKFTKWLFTVICTGVIGGAVVWGLISFNESNSTSDTIDNSENEISVQSEETSNGSTADNQESIKDIMAKDLQFHADSSGRLCTKGYVYTTIYENTVCLDIETWEGSGDYINIPIVGVVGANIESVTLDGTPIVWNEEGSVYQRVELMVYGGLNKYEVVVINNDGERVVGSVETVSESLNTGQDINVWNY